MRSATFARSSGRTHMTAKTKTMMEGAAMSPKPWVIGALVRQLFSIAGPQGRSDVNQTLIQPFINYNLPEGWYLVSSPIITANWSAPSSQRWTVPIGGGGGKILKIGDQPINAQLQAFHYVARPNAGPDWAVRFSAPISLSKVSRHEACSKDHFPPGAAEMSANRLHWTDRASDKIEYPHLIMR